MVNQSLMMMMMMTMMMAMMMVMMMMMLVLVQKTFISATVQRSQEDGTEERLSDPRYSFIISMSSKASTLQPDVGNRDGHADIFADAHRCGYPYYPTYVGHCAISTSAWPSLVGNDYDHNHDQHHKKLKIKIESIQPVPL